MVGWLGVSGCSLDVLSRIIVEVGCLLGDRLSCVWFLLLVSSEVWGIVGESIVRVFSVVL